MAIGGLGQDLKQLWGRWRKAPITGHVMAGKAILDDHLGLKPQAPSHHPQQQMIKSNK
jgi:hypothetical protein